MSDNVTKKRSYTIPVLYISLVLLMTFVIIAYSKYLLSEQSHITDKGKRLSEQYNYALLFADRLHEGSEGLLNAATVAEQMQAARLLGEANVASGETLGLLIEAASQSNGQSSEEAGKLLISAMNSLVGPESPLASIGEHEGPLTDEERADLTVVRDGTAQMLQILDRFNPPSGEVGYRQMIRIGDWIESAAEAGTALEQLAEKL